MSETAAAIAQPVAHLGKPFPCFAVVAEKGGRQFIDVTADMPVVENPLPSQFLFGVLAPKVGHAFKNF